MVEPAVSAATVTVTAYDTSGASSVETGTVDLDLALDGQSISLAETFTACNVIQATNFQVLPPGGNVVFVAGTSIAL